MTDYIADGVPPFVEELTKNVLESTNSDTALDVPSTLQDSLMSRLDRSADVYLESYGEASITVIEGASRSGGFRHELAASCADLAYTRLLQNKHAEALELANKSLEVSTPMDNKLESGFAHLVLAQALATKEHPDFNSAAHHQSIGARELREAGAELDIGIAELVAGRIAFARNDLVAARTCGQAARAI